MENTDIKTNEGAPQVKSIIKVVGVGGSGIHVVNQLYNESSQNLTFAICDTDRQALDSSPIREQIQLDNNAIEKTGTALQISEKIETEIRSLLSDGTKMLLIIAGMGRLTGTSFAPEIARISKELGILTIGIVSIPFRFEGPEKINQALDGMAEMLKYVDSLIGFNYEHLREIYPQMGVLDAFSQADKNLQKVTKDITDIITCPGQINLDFYDMKAILKDSGLTLVGIGYGEGENAVQKAIGDAVLSPFFNNNDLFNSKKVLLSITTPDEKCAVDLTMKDPNYLSDFATEFEGSLEMRWGLKIDPKLGNRVKATIIATGFDLEHLDGLMATRLKYDLSNSLKEIQVIGVNNHRVESMDILKKRLSDISKIPTEYWQHDGAMCYCPVPGKLVKLKHKCPTCGKKYEYEDWVFNHNSRNDRYADEEKRIKKFITEINSLGHHAYIEHMCENCYNSSYDGEMHGISIFVLHFRHKEGNKDVVNVVTEYECRILSEFLKGNNSMRGDHDNTIWFKEYVVLLERLLGVEKGEDK